MRTALLVALLVTMPGARGDVARPHFYDDDPIRTEPASQDAGAAVPRNLELAWEVLYHLFATSQTSKQSRALEVNTIDDVPDSDWYTNRDLAHLSQADVETGPVLHGGPVAPWTILSGKTDGIMPGFVAKDAAGVRWFIKLDAPGYPELASGAEVIATRLFWALGYNVPENQIAFFTTADLRIDPAATFKDSQGRKRPLTKTVFDRVLASAARHPDGRYRVLASRALDGKPIGPFLYSGTRSDDPNDIFAHEHRRSLRALKLFSAWLNHVDAKSGNTLDTLVRRVDGRTVVRHHLLDFGSTLGSAGIGPREFDEGNAYLFERGAVAKSALTLGLTVPAWRRTPFSAPPSVGRFEGEHFDPALWKPRIPNAAFIEAMPDDLFWAARKLFFVDRRIIEAAVRAARYSDPEAAPYLVTMLLKRRDRVLEAYLDIPAPIVDVRLSAHGILYFGDAAVDADVAKRPKGYWTWWYEFNNSTGESQLLGECASARRALEAPAALPGATGSYVRIDIAPGNESGHQVAARVFFRRTMIGWRLVGLDRMLTRASEVTRP